MTLHRDGLDRITRYHWDERFNITATVIAAGTRDETRIQTPFDASGVDASRKLLTKAQVFQFKSDQGV